MSNVYQTKGLTGKSARKFVNVKSQALVAPVVAEPEILLAKHYINDRTLSGKQKGAVIIHRGASADLSLCIATGAKPTDKWLTIPKASVVTVTPA